MWLEASDGTDRAGATPIKAMSARVSARRGLRAILFIRLFSYGKLLGASGIGPIGSIGLLSPIESIQNDPKSAQTRFSRLSQILSPGSNENADLAAIRA